MEQLSDAEKTRIKQEEIFRKAIRQEIEKTSSEPKSNNLLALFANNGFQWAIAALLIPSLSFIYNYYESQIEEEKIQLEKEELKIKQETENIQQYTNIVIQLLPDLAKPMTSAEYRNAMSIITTLDNTGKMPISFKPVLNNAIDDASREASKQNYQPSTAPSINETNQTQNLDLTPPTSTLFLPTTTVYTQIFDEKDRIRAIQLGDLLRSMNIISPKIENVVETATKKNSKRPNGYNAPVLIFFKSADKITAEQIVKEAKAKIGLTLSIRDRSTNPNFFKVPSGQMEVWFADSNTKN